MCCCCTGVTLNRNLFETALRYLLVDSAEYTVQLFEGSGSHWKKTRYTFFPHRETGGNKRDFEVPVSVS